MKPQQWVVREKQDVFNIVNTTNILNARALLITVIALGGTFIDAYDIGSLGIGTVQLRSQFHLTPSLLGSLVAMMGLGAVFGGLIGGYYNDKIGRLKMFLIDLFLFVGSAILAAFSPNVWWLMAFRFLMGFGVGLDFPVALSFVAELRSIKKKGQGVIAWQFMWASAGTLAFLAIIPVYLSGVGDNLWRYAVGFGAIPAVVVIILRYAYMKESPMWAASQGRLKEAVDILRNPYGVDVVLAADAKQERRVVRLSDYGHLFRDRFRARSTLVGVVSLMGSLEYYAIGFYIPIIISLLLGKNLIVILLGSAIINAFSFLGATPAYFLIQRLGLRRMIIIGFSGTAAMLVIIGLFGHAVPPVLALVFIGVFIGFHNFGQGPGGSTLGALSYPTAIRGMGSGFAQVVIRGASVLAFYAFPPMLAALGFASTVLIIALAPIIGLLVTIAIKWDPINRDVDSEEALLDRPGTVATVSAE